MGGNKITGVGKGTANSDAVNKTQLDALETQINTILNSLTKLKYRYFTNQLSFQQ